jgi:hypothetical protein
MSACNVDKKYADAIEVATNFLTAYENCDFIKAYEFASPSAKKNLTMEQLLHNEKIDKLRKQNDLTISLKEKSVTSSTLTDTVWATFMVNGHIDKAFFSDNEPCVNKNPIEQRIIIAKINNKWLADLIY